MESRDFEVLKEYNQVIDERVATFNTEHIDVDGIAGWTKSGLILVADSEEMFSDLCGHSLPHSLLLRGVCAILHLCP